MCPESFLHTRTNTHDLSMECLLLLSIRRASRGLTLRPPPIVDGSTPSRFPRRELVFFLPKNKKVPSKESSGRLSASNQYRKVDCEEARVYMCVCLNSGGWIELFVRSGTVCIFFPSSLVRIACARTYVCVSVCIRCAWQHSCVLFINNTLAREKVVAFGSGEKKTTA